MFTTFLQLAKSYSRKRNFCNQIYKYIKPLYRSKSTTYSWYRTKPSIISCKTTSKVSNLVNYSINIQRNVFDGKRGKRIRLCAVPTNHKYNLLMSCIIWTKNYITLHGHIKIFFHYTLKCVKYKSIFNADFTLHR